MRRAPLPLVLALVLSSAGCARLLRQYDVAPNGLPRAESRLREWLAEGRADSATARLTRGEAAPGDELLRTLFFASAAHYDGDAEASVAWLERAAELAEERETKSVSRSVLSLVSNDLILPYEPSRTERLFIPYYGALARLRLGDLQGAAVEARRLSALLERYEAKGWDGEKGLRASLRYFAGTVFDAARERNDAAVAYRNAAVLAEGLVGAADTALAAACCLVIDSAAVATGEVVVFIEQGYVAHRAGEALWILLAPHEVLAFGESDHDGRALLATTIAHRVLTGEPPPRSSLEACSAGGACSGAGGNQAAGSTNNVDDKGKPYLLKIAWPVMRRPSRAVASLQLAAGDSLFAVRDIADVSASALSDFDGERPLILARTIARAALKAAIAKGAEKKAEEKEEGSGKLVGMLANAGGVLLEQADTRSWHLLPSRLAVARVRLPAGRQQLAVMAGGRSVELGEIDVPADGVAVASARIW